MKKSTVAYIIILVLSIALAGAVGYIIRDKVVVNVENDVTSTTNTDNQTTVNTYDKINYEIVDNKVLKVNDNTVSFKDCDEISSIQNVEQLADVLVVNAGCGADLFLSVVDKSGNQIAGFYPELLKNDTATKIDKSIALYTKAVYRDTFRIEGNDLYVETDNLGQENHWHTCYAMSKDPNTTVIYEEKFTYLGDGKLSDPVVIKTVSAKDYKEQKNIDCTNIKFD